VRPVASWLERFRRPAGVPAAATEELEAELMPVFAALDAIETDAGAIRAAAAAEASRRVDAAVVEAERLLVDWRRKAEVERANAQAARRGAIASQARSIEAEAEQEAARIRARGRERIPELVADVVACITGERP
jgi:vacuolar-type H+-ATPase subunit H